MKRLGVWLLTTLRFAAWAPIGVFLTHVIGSKVFLAYKSWPSFDVPMHLAGGLAIAYFFHVASIQGSALGVLGSWHRTSHALLVFGWTAVAAIVWEFAEFTSDRFLGTRMQGGDLTDTLKDLLLGLIGGAGLIAWAWAFRRNPPTPQSLRQGSPEGESDANQP